MTAWKRGKRRDSGENPSAERGGGGLLRQPGLGVHLQRGAVRGEDGPGLVDGLLQVHVEQQHCIEDLDDGRMRGRTASWVSGRTVGSSSWEK